MGMVEAFIWGLFGSAGAEVSSAFTLRHRAWKDFPYWLKSPPYYITSIAMALIGAGIAAAYSRSGTMLSPILAIQIGASAPLIFRKLTEVVPEKRKPLDLRKID